MIPGIGGILGGVVSTGANILQGLVGIAANVVGGILNAFGALLKGIVGIFQRIVGAIGRILGKIPKLALVTAGAAIGAQAAFTALLNSVAKTGDEIAKMAKRTGLSVKFLSEMQHALELNDATLDDLQKGIRGMGTFVEGAERGMKEYLDVLRQLGVSYKDARGNIKGTEELFVELVDALRQIPNPLLRAGLAQRIFSRSAMRLIPFIIETTDSIKEQREEAHKLGVVWDKEGAMKAERFRDALTRVKNALRGLRNQFLIPFLEPFAKRLEDLSKWLSSDKDRIREWGEKASEYYEKFADRATKALGRVWTYLKETNWAGAWAGVLAFPERMWDEVIPDIGKLFVDKSGGGWMGPITETIVHAVRWLKNAVLNIVDEIWAEIGPRAMKFIHDLLFVAATAIREGARRMMHGLSAQGTVAMAPIYNMLQGFADALEDVGIAAYKTGQTAGQSAQRVTARVKEQESALKAMRAAAAEARDALAGIGGKIRGAAGEALPAAKPAEQIAAQREEGRRAGVRETPAYKKRAGKVAQLRRFAGKARAAKDIENAEAMAAKAVELQQALDDYVEQVEEAFKRQDEALKRQGDTLRQHARLLGRIGTARA